MAALVTVAIYYDLPSAVVAKARLDQYGFTVFLSDWQYATVAWHLMHALGGLRMMVPEPEAADALEILEGPTADAGPDPLDICPVCGSENVFRRSSWFSFPASVPLGVGILFRTAKRFCRDCRHRWRDPG